jgi:hypothetical protein
MMVMQRSRDDVDPEVNGQRGNGNQAAAQEAFHSLSASGSKRLLTVLTGFSNTKSYAV